MLLGTTLRVKVFDALDFLYVIRAHYGNAGFRAADRALRRSSWLRNPYRISRRFLEARGASDIHVYGETPIRTLERLMRQCGVDETDHVFELGSGRGRTCLWLRACLGCSVTGIEFIPCFVQTVREVTIQSGLDRISFREENFFTADLSTATFVYLCGTCLGDQDVEKLATHLSEQLQNGTRILTISYPLSDFAPAERFPIERTLSARFPWGTTDAYLQRVINTNEPD